MMYEIYEPFVFFTLVACVVFQVLAWRAEDRAYEAEQKYKRLRLSLWQLEFELKLKADVSDPEFIAGWNMAMQHTKSMIREIKKHA